MDRSNMPGVGLACGLGHMRRPLRRLLVKAPRAPPPGAGSPTADQQPLAAGKVSRSASLPRTYVGPMGGVHRPDLPLADQDEATGSESSRRSKVRRQHATSLLAGWESRRGRSRPLALQQPYWARRP
jgi:hypothetical protein